MSDKPIRLARFKDSHRGLIHSTAGGIHKFLRENAIFRVQERTNAAYSGLYKVLDADVGSLYDGHLDFIDDGYYVLTTGAFTFYKRLPDLLRTISDLPEGSQWSYYPAMNPNEVTTSTLGN